MMRQCPSCLQYTNRPVAACPNCSKPFACPATECATGADTWDAWDARERADMRAWLSARPRDERLILELHYTDGLTDGEIAEVLDFGESFVAETRRHATDQAQEVLQ